MKRRFINGEREREREKSVKSFEGVFNSGDVYIYNIIYKIIIYILYARCFVYIVEETGGVHKSTAIKYIYDTCT